MCDEISVEVSAGKVVGVCWANGLLQSPVNKKEAKRIEVRKSTFVVAGKSVFLRVCCECVVFCLLVCFGVFLGGVS